MPGKHAPPSPMSFYLSLARAGAGALAVLGVVVLVAVVAVNSRGDEGDPRALGTLSASPTPSVQPSRTERTPTADPTPTPSVRPVGEVSVRVLNANGTAGLAGRTSDEIDEAGYRVLAPGNADVVDETVIYYRRDAEADALALREALFGYVDPSRVQPATRGLPSGLIVVVLGKDHPS